MSRILAIEPDPERGRALTRLVRQRVDAEVVLAQSSEAAIASIAEQVPDVILTSTLMPPSDELHLTAHLKRVPDLWRLPILTIPPVVDTDEPRLARNRGLRSFFNRKSAPPWPAYDQEALGARIEEAFSQSRSAEISSHVSLAPIVDVLTVPRSLERSNADAVEMSDDELLNHLGLGVKRIRAHRWAGTDLPWLSGVRLPWGLDVRLLNISKSGLLVESGNKLMPGVSTAFRLWGPNKEIVVPARVVRSSVMDVNPRGVTYQAAAVFDRMVELLAPRPTARKTSTGTPVVLADLVARVQDEADRGANPAVLRSAFELGVQQLVTAREIRIRDVPVVTNDGSESIYFTVPTRPDSIKILQATFEPHYRPQAEEFEVLKAAAVAAADVLDIEERSAGRLIPLG